jgi:Na+/H+-translocating membrane pyrophosphatase
MSALHIRENPPTNTILTEPVFLAANENESAVSSKASIIVLIAVALGFLSLYSMLGLFGLLISATGILSGAVGFLFCWGIYFVIRTRDNAPTW